MRINTVTIERRGGGGGGGGWVCVVWVGGGGGGGESVQLCWPLVEGGRDPQQWEDGRPGI